MTLAEYEQRRSAADEDINPNALGPGKNLIAAGDELCFVQAVTA